MPEINLKLNLAKATFVGFQIAVASGLAFGFNLSMSVMNFFAMAIFVFVGITVIDGLVVLHGRRKRKKEQ